MREMRRNDESLGHGDIDSFNPGQPFGIANMCITVPVSHSCRSSRIDPQLGPAVSTETPAQRAMLSEFVVSELIYYFRGIQRQHEERHEVTLNPQGMSASK
jgi:hypothetical protein